MHHYPGFRLTRDADEAWHTFPRLLPGQAFQLANDHDPWALCDQFTEDHGMSSASRSRWTMPHVAVALPAFVLIRKPTAFGGHLSHAGR